MRDSVTTDSFSRNLSEIKILPLLDETWKKQLGRNVVEEKRFGMLRKP